MHYKNNRPVQIGDPVIGISNQIPIVGTVIASNASETCNLTIASVQQIKQDTIKENNYPLIDQILAVLPDGDIYAATTYSAYTASDFLHAADALKEDA
jgi:hypothetical protein